MKILSVRRTDAKDDDLASQILAYNKIAINAFKKRMVELSERLKQIADSYLYDEKNVNGAFIGKDNVQLAAKCSSIIKDAASKVYAQVSNIK